LTPSLGLAVKIAVCGESLPREATLLPLNDVLNLPLCKEITVVRTNMQPGSTAVRRKAILAN